MSVSKILQTNITCPSSGWVNLAVNNINVCGSITGPGAPTEVVVRNSSTTGSSLVTEPSPKNYEIRRLRASTGINLIDDPDYVGIESTVNSYSLAAARIGIDPTSNPGPIIGGLLFDPTLTLTGTFALPLTTASFSTGICDNFLDDADNYFTLISPTELQINVSGKYNMSGNIIVLTNDPLTPLVIQVLRNTDVMFAAPPAMTDARGILSAGTSPISALYSNIYTMGFTEDCSLVAGDIIGVKLYAEGGTGGDSAEISLCSSLCIHLIGGTSSGAGSAVNAVNSLGSGETLLNPAGTGPVVAVKSLIAGRNISLTPTANDITVAYNTNRILEIDDFINSPGQQIAFLSAQSSSVSLMTFFAVPLALCSVLNSFLTAATNGIINYNTKAMDPLIPGVYGIIQLIYRGSLTVNTTLKWTTFSLCAPSPTSTNNFQRNLFNFLLSSSTNISRVYKLYFEPTLELAADGTTVLNTFNNFSDDFYFSFGISNLTTIQRDLSLTSGNPYKNDLASSVQCFLYKLAGVSYASITILDNLVVVSTEDIPISSLLINTVYYLKIEVVSSNIIISFIDNAAAIIFTRSYNISLLNNNLSYGFYNNYTMYNVSDTTFNVAQFSYDYISTETERALVL